MRGLIAPRREEASQRSIELRSYVVPSIEGNRILNTVKVFYNSHSIATTCILYYSLRYNQPVYSCQLYTKAVLPVPWVTVIKGSAVVYK